MNRLAKNCVIIIVFLFLVVVSTTSFLLYRSGCEKAANLQEEATQTWSNVEKHLQERAELVPNLLGTVRGYVEFEKELFENIAKSRQKYLQAVSRAEKIDASYELSGFLSQLPELQKKYRELKANESFVSLLGQLEATEDSIAAARNAYNDSANRLNTYARGSFGKYFCKKAGIEQVELFKDTE